MKENKKTFRIELDIEKFTGKLAREQYLEENPDGYRRVKKIHKNKKKYNRKNKHKGRKPLFLFLNIYNKPYMLSATKRFWLRQKTVSPLIFLKTL